MKYMKYFKKIDGNYFASTEAVSLLTGVDRARFLSWHWNNEDMIKKVRDPDDGRKVLFDVLDLVILIMALGEGKFRSRTFRTRDMNCLDYNSPVLTEAASFLDLRPFGFLYRFSTGLSFLKNPEEDNTVFAAKFNRERGGSVALGMVSYVREGVEHVVKRQDNLTADSYRKHLSFVENGCWGWADEKSEECSQHCALFSACAEARLDRLEEMANQLEIRDAAKRKYTELKGEMDRIRILREDVESQIDSIFS